MKSVVIVSILTVLFSVSCSHQSYKSFQEIQIGNDKSDLIDKVGSPFQSTFKNGQEVWIYKFYENNNFIYKDVFFSKDKITLIQDHKENAHLKPQDEKKIENDLQSIKKGETNIVPKSKSHEDPMKDLKSAPESFVPVE